MERQKNREITRKFEDEEEKMEEEEMEGRNGNREEQGKPEK